MSRGEWLRLAGLAAALVAMLAALALGYGSPTVR